MLTANDAHDTLSASSSAEERPRTPCIIDHTMYPHIIDSVVATLSPQASLVLRATSREFRDRVDNELWRHISVGPSDKGMGISIAAAGGNMPLQVRHCGHTMHTHHCTDSSPSASDVHPALLKRARIVSVRGPVDAYAGSLAWFSPKLTGIETLRLLPPMPRPFTIWPDTVRGARTVIIFTTMSRGSRHYIQTGNDQDPAMLYKPPFAPVPPITSSARRLVITVTYHGDDPFLPESRLAQINFAAHLAELVVIFKAAEPADVVPDLGAPSRIPLRRPTLGIMYPVVHGMLSNARIKVTIVGVAAMGNSALGLSEDLEPEQVYDKLLETAAEIFLTQGVGFDQRNPTKNLRFMDLEEYRQTIDESDFELEFSE